MIDLNELLKPKIHRVTVILSTVVKAAKLEVYVGAV